MAENFRVPEDLFGESDFEEKMNSVVRPFLEQNLQDGTFTSYDGTRIHYSCLLHPQEKAAIVISHGFCEFIGKYHETMYYFYRAGYSVFFIDHRGHGYSQRFVKEPDKVQITDYDEYVGDLKEYLDKIVRPESTTGRLLLFAHSMGGAIGSLFLERYPEYFEAAILSSPMIQMRIGDYPNWQVRLLFAWSTVAGWNLRYAPGQRGFDNIYVFEHSSTLSEPRYAYMFRLRQEVPEYQTYGGTYSWVKASCKASDEIKRNAAKVQIPVLLFQAGRDTMVLPQAQELFISRAGDAKLIRFPESKHEIFNATQEMRSRYYQEIFGFYGKQGVLCRNIKKDLPE